VQDSEEITNIELADAFQQMWAKRRYNEIFFMIDTCQVILPSDIGLSSILLADMGQETIKRDILHDRHLSGI
jgi:glycosylphosphatidylinositol transamidase (GPIT) subunit GPI8